MAGDEWDYYPWKYSKPLYEPVKKPVFYPTTARADMYALPRPAKGFYKGQGVHRKRYDEILRMLRESGLAKQFAPPMRSE